MTEALMEMTDLYYVGDLRMCYGSLCGRRVVYTGYGWTHMPESVDRDNGYRPGSPFVYHEARPFLDHKHRFKLQGVDKVSYIHECRICSYRASTSRKVLRYLLTNRWFINV